MKKGKISLFVVIVLFFGTFSSLLLFLPENVIGTTIYVGGSGPGNYTKIQDAIDAANPGDSIYVYNGTYYEHVVVYKTLTLIGEDRNTTVINGSGWGDVLRVLSDWVNVTGFTITNGGFSGTDSGLELFEVREGYIANNNLSSTNLNGIYLHISHNNIIANNIVTDNWYGIWLLGSNGNTIINNTATYNLGDGIRLGSSDNNFVSDNFASHNAYDGIRVGGSYNTIIQNTLENNSYGIFIGSSEKSTIAGNLMMRNGIFLSGYRLEHWTTHSIETTNTVNGKPVFYWKNATGGIVPLGAGEVILANCTNVVVQKQNLNNSTVGIELGFSSNNAINSNNVSGEVYGIHLFLSDRNTVADNEGWNNEYGVSTLMSENNTIDHNNVTGNLEGVRIFRSANNTVSNNHVFSNTEHGIHFEHAINNLAINNTITSNLGYGVTLSDSQGSGIYHNYMSNNTIHAYDDAGSNQWDDGYPSGGNYWDNYTGYDNMSGPDQDLPGSDGIGDTPFVIDVDSRDRYPLMNPLGVGLPRPPRILYANLSGDKLENVTITWALSPDDRAEFTTVAGYRVYRNMTYDPRGLGYSLVATLPNGTSEFTDPSVGEGDPDDYFYRVCVVDVNNNTTCSPNQGSKFTRPLWKGPNLLSIPLIQSNESVEAVLQTVAFDRVWSYDSSIGEWKSYMIQKPYRGTLQEIDHTMGFWVNVTLDSNLTVAGVVPYGTPIHLKRGWNLVSFPSFRNNYTVAEFKLETNASRVEAFDQLSPPYYLRVTDDSDFLLTGLGYWVSVDSEITWNVSNL